MAYDPTIQMLIIDDDVQVLGVLEDLFSAEEHLSVTALSESLEAIELIKRKRFDLVITDLSMPKADGIAVTRAVQAANLEALVVIITGYASLETTLEAIHLGVYDYITKPFQIGEFRILISNAARRIRLERENRYLNLQIELLTKNLKALESERAVLLGRLDEATRRLAHASQPEAERLNPAARRPLADPNKILFYERMAAEGRVVDLGVGKPVNEVGGEPMEGEPLPRQKEAS
ncbi:MAG: response regulator [Candidatus Sumerlaeota bacterium]|nr:response regulator [Candidatus Sumerlaeota bacterium]